MGKWEELNVEIDVTVDTSDIDKVIDDINSGDSDIAELFAPAIEILSNYKKGVESGSKKGAEKVADRTRSLQELTIAMNGSIAKGNLINSIEVEKKSDTNYLVGTNIDHFYPLTIEKGRGEVRPIRFKFLHYFTLSGIEIFSKYSRPTTPKPYVEPSYRQVLSEAEDIVWEEIANATK